MRLGAFGVGRTGQVKPLSYPLLLIREPHRCATEPSHQVIGTDGRIDVGEFVGDFGPIRGRLWSGAGSHG